jgi:hypothetical protein
VCSLFGHGEYIGTVRHDVKATPTPLAGYAWTRPDFSHTANLQGRHVHQQQIVRYVWRRLPTILSCQRSKARPPSAAGPIQLMPQDALPDGAGTCRVARSGNGKKFG